MDQEPGYVTVAMERNARVYGKDWWDDVMELDRSLQLNLCSHRWSWYMHKMAVWWLVELRLAIRFVSGVDGLFRNYLFCLNL